MRRDTYNQALRAAQKAQAATTEPRPAHIPRKREPIARPVLTPEEKQAAHERATAALRAEHEFDQANREKSRKYSYCEMCGEPATKRTLCNNHYQLALRAGELEAYPTKQFLDRPADHAVWLITYFPELLQDALTQAGWIEPSNAL